MCKYCSNNLSLAGASMISTRMFNIYIEYTLENQGTEIYSLHISLKTIEEAQEYLS